jgi:hypothetical protein
VVLHNAEANAISWKKSLNNIYLFEEFPDVPNILVKFQNTAVRRFTSDAKKPPPPITVLAKKKSS